MRLVVLRNGRGADACVVHGVWDTLRRRPDRAARAYVDKGVEGNHEASNALAVECVTGWWRPRVVEFLDMA